MIRSQSVEEHLRQVRMDAKTLDSLFRRQIEVGANCPPFVSQAILRAAKDVYCLDLVEANGELGVGQMKFLCVTADERAGKSLETCQKVTVMLTLDAGDDDLQVRLQQGGDALRRGRILRLCCEARDQGGLLTYEDLAYRLLNCGVRTIVRDVKLMQTQGLVVPSRGQQQDIGPGQTHRVQAVRLFLQGHEPQEIARRIYHSLKSVERYLDAFGRVVFLSTRGCDDDEIAFILRRSTVLVAAYRELAHQLANTPSAQRRIEEIVQRVENERFPRKKTEIPS